MIVTPLKEGRRSIKEQAAARGVDMPVGVTVQALHDQGYDVDAEWDFTWIVQVCPSSPTGFCVGPSAKVFYEAVAIYALAH